MEISKSEANSLKKYAGQVGNCMAFLAGKDVAGGGGGAPSAAALAKLQEYKKLCIESIESILKNKKLKGKIPMDPDKAARLASQYLGA